jgi:hypothetical protein
VKPRTFELVRYRDLSGVSGTGVVAEGCVFTDGSVALRWRGNNPATAVWPDLESVLAVHGHHGATEVNWLEDVATTDLGDTAERHLELSPERQKHTAERLEFGLERLEHTAERRLTPRPKPRPVDELTPAAEPLSGDRTFSGEPGYGVEPEGWSAPEDWTGPTGWVEPAGEQEQPEFDLEKLLGGQHQVRPPSSTADPSGPSAHARGWAAARHLR